MPGIKKVAGKKKSTTTSRKKGAPKKSKPSGSMFSKFEGASLDQLDITIFGESGSGKTTLACDAPGPIAYLQCSKIQGAGELIGIDPTQIPGGMEVCTVESSEDFVSAVNEIKSSNYFKSAVLDHSTDFQNIVLSEAADKPVPEQLKFSFTTREVWQQVAFRMKEYLAAFISLELHTLVLAQQRVFPPKEDIEDSELAGLINTRVGSALSPSVCQWLHSACTYNFETFTRPKMKLVDTGLDDEDEEPEYVRDGDNQEFCLRYGTHDVFMTKARINKKAGLGSGIMVDPTFKKLLKLIEGGKFN